MKLLYSLIIAVSFAAAQTVTVAAQNGTSAQSTQLSVVAKSTTTFGLSSTIASSTGTAVLNLSAATTRQQVQPRTLAFTVSWVQADVVASSVSVSAGPALNGTGKTLTCNLVITGPPGLNCAISGGTTTIPDGVVALVNSTVNKSTAFTLSGVSSTNKFGVPLATTITPGGVITMPTLLASVACVSPQIESGEDVACSATLNQPAPAGGTTIALSSSDTTLIAIISPAGVAISSVTVAAGTLVGNFVARGL